MARQVGVDLDFSLVAQILNARLHNVTTSQRTSLGNSLTGSNTGLVVYDTDEKQIYTWDGSQFIPTKVQGAMVYKGAHTSLTTAPANPDIGFTYVFTGTAGTLTWVGQTFSPYADIDHGDVLIYRGADNWDIIEGNDGSSANYFTNIAVTGQNTVVADQANDTLTLVAGTNVAITTDDVTDTITISNTFVATNAFGIVTGDTGTATADLPTDTLAITGGTGIGTAATDTPDGLVITNTDTGSAAITAHEAAADPHPQYTTTAEAAAAAPVQSVAAGTGISVNQTTGNVTVTNADRGSTAVATHEAAADPHPQYATDPEVRALIKVHRNIFLWPGSGAPSSPADTARWGEWHGAITDSTGTRTFNVTTDGTANGPPIFANLAACIPQVTCVRDTDLNNESPWAHIRRIEDNRRVVVQVKKSNTGPVILLGSYSGNLNNDNPVTVYLTMKGVLA